MLKTKSVKPVQNISINKKEFIKGLIKEGSTIIWPKEMKMANLLFKIFPDEGFWKNLNLDFKLNISVQKKQYVFSLTSISNSLKNFSGE